MKRLFAILFILLLILPVISAKAFGNVEENISTIKDREGYKKYDFELSKEEIEKNQYLIYREEYHFSHPEKNSDLSFTVENNEFMGDGSELGVNSVEDFSKLFELGYLCLEKSVRKVKIDFPKYTMFSTVYFYSTYPNEFQKVHVNVFNGIFNEKVDKLRGDIFSYVLFPNDGYDASFHQIELLKTDTDELYYNSKNDPCIGEWIPKEDWYKTDKYVFTDYLNLEDEFKVLEQVSVDYRVSIRTVGNRNTGGIENPDTTGGNTSGTNIGGGGTNPLVDGMLPFIGSLLSILGLLGLSSGLSGLGGTSGLNGNNVDNPDGEEDESTLSLEAKIHGGPLIAGNTRKSVTLSVSIIGNAEESEKSEVARTISVAPSGDAIGSDYVYIEEENHNSGMEKLYYISFTYLADSKFYKGDSGITFPIEIPLVVNSDSSKVTAKRVILKVEKDEMKLLLEPKSIVIADNQNQHYPINVRVKSMEKIEWKFSTEIETSLEMGIKHVDCIDIEADKCGLKISPEILPEGSGTSVSNTVIVKAFNEKTNKLLQKKLAVTIAREGLIVVNEQALNIIADGISKSKIKIGAVTAEYGELKTDYDLLSSIKIEPKIITDEKLAENAFDASKIQFGKGDWDNFDGYKNRTLSTYSYDIMTTRAIPGNGSNYRGKLRVSASNKDKTYNLEIPLVLDVLSMGPGSPSWQKELKNCRDTIKLIPNEYQPKMNSILESKSKVMGARGLYELRKKIWKIGLTLWEAEGGKGYEDLERWAGYIEDTLNVAHWLGRMATDIAGTMVTGSPYLGMVVGESHDAIVSALVSYRDGLDLSEWYDKYFYGDLMDIIEGIGEEAISRENMIKVLEKFFKKNPKLKLAAYTMLFIYNLTMNICRRDMDVFDAAKAAIKDMVYAEVLKFAAGRISKKIGKGKAKGDINNASNNKGKAGDIADFNDSMTNQKGFSQANKKINKLHDAIESGDPKAIDKAVYDIKTDKYAIAEINKKIDGKSVYPDSMKIKVEDVYDNMVKKPVNSKLNNKIEDLYNKKSNVSKVIEIEDTGRSNPTKDAKVGSDWDVGKKVTFIDNNGRVRTEIMKAKDMKPLLTDSINETIGNKYGKGISPEDLRAKNDIEPMGKDAAGGFADDVDKAVGIKSNKKYYYDNPLDIKDPQAFGKTAKHKVLEWWSEKSDHLTKSGAKALDINSSKLEGLKQYNKQYNTLLKPMEDIAKIKKPNLKAPPKVLDQFQKLTDEVIKGHKSIEYMENTLKKSGYSVEKILDIFGSHIEVYAKEL
ncbi:hypothetical protein SH2C18_46940 [Clostridium sediminicola]|uniref:hypothetical protein n=1 Tax=Clostridium sediminicola TaxID=3114879 RepID=UPI0031F1C805